MKAKLTRERLLNSATVMKTASEANSPIVTEVETTATPEIKIEDRAGPSHEVHTQTRVIRTLSPEDDDYLEEGLYSPGDGQQMDLKEEDVPILDERAEDRRRLK